MSKVVDYYYTPASPWTYLGHQRFWDIARSAGASIRVLPVDLGGKVFPVSGGLPLSKRAPQRQAYRLTELRRFSEFLQVPLNVQPHYFPVSGDDAAQLIIAVDMKDGSDAAMRIAGAVMRAVWVEPHLVVRTKIDLCCAANGLPVSALSGAGLEALCEALDHYAFGAPNDNGDLIAWAEGGGTITRNGKACPANRVWGDSLRSSAAIFRASSVNSRSLSRASSPAAQASGTMLRPPQWAESSASARVRG